MSKQPEARRLAHNLDSEDVDLCNLPDAAAELRRLHDVELHLKQVERGFDKLHALNAELVGALASIVGRHEGDAIVATKGNLKEARAALKKATEQS